MATSVTIPVSTDGHGPVYVTTLTIGPDGVATTAATVAVSHGEVADAITVSPGTAVLLTSAVLHSTVTATATVGPVSDAVSGDAVPEAEPASDVVAAVEPAQTVVDSEAI